MIGVWRMSIDGATFRLVLVTVTATEALEIAVDHRRLERQVGPGGRYWIEDLNTRNPLTGLPRDKPDSSGRSSNPARTSRARPPTAI